MAAPLLYLKLVGIVVCLLVLYVVFVFVANRFHTPPDVAFKKFSGNATGDCDSEISIASWNIGYAGMGEESDFFMDLGEQKRPLSATLVDKNLHGIESELSKLGTDIIFLQEVAQPSLNTYSRNVYAGIRNRLSDYSSAFSPDIHLRFLPSPMNVRVGNAIFTRCKAGQLELRPLAFEPTYIAYTFRKTYRMHIVRINNPQPWVFINIHLSAFDTPANSVREKQLRQVVAFAQEEYAKGARVVVGGDWNLRLLPTKFPHNTAKKFQFWIRDLPDDVTPLGWHWAADPTQPTVRTANKPYVAGENMTLIIDGFLVSPNVEIVDVHAINLNFQYSDHNPIMARFRSTSE